LRGSPQDVLDRLKDPQQRLRIEKDLHEQRSEGDWTRIMVGTTIHPEHERFRGLRVADVAEEWGVVPEEAVTRLLVEDEGKTGGIFFGLSENNMYKVLSHPLVMIGSDASLRAPQGPLSMDHPHPRAYGTFPRVLRWALDGRICELPELVRKMTRLPAEQFGLKNRGRIEPQAMADIVVFDPETVRDIATYAKPHQFPEGIETVLVNGVLTVEDGRITAGRGGRFLG
jgi:N-acyl-D-amino-acid deacylase